ncbi:MAG: bifunctional phosphopantothenoylcysteine decarboxylase/phosphopantothenate--cysteine ligase CoaBC [Victivallaceae bacterium]
MRILITAGPTREAIDAVRFITNHSSGKMGFALAEAAQAMGHEVVLIAGPVNLTPPLVYQYIPVVSAAEMAQAVHANAPSAQVIIMSAAVADYRPAQPIRGKMKKKSGPLTLELERTEDILQSLGAAKQPGQILLGFAAESENLLAYAQDKLIRKNLDFIAANDISVPDRGFGAEQNEITLLGRDGSCRVLPLQDKKVLASALLKLILPAGK